MMREYEYRVVDSRGVPCAGGQSIPDLLAAMSFAVHLDDVHDSAVCGRHIVESRSPGEWVPVDERYMPGRV